jgi:hypothetical protein
MFYTINNNQITLQKAAKLDNPEKYNNEKLSVT